jgi:hypothetical protein
MAVGDEIIDLIKRIREGSFRVRTTYESLDASRAKLLGVSSPDYEANWGSRYRSARKVFGGHADEVEFAAKCGNPDRVMGHLKTQEQLRAYRELQDLTTHIPTPHLVPRLTEQLRRVELDFEDYAEGLDTALAKYFAIDKSKLDRRIFKMLEVEVAGAKEFLRQVNNKNQRILEKYPHIRQLFESEARGAVEA